MIIKRGAKIQDHDDHRNSQDRVKTVHELFQTFLAHHIWKCGGEGHTDEHKIEHRAGQYNVIEEETCRWRCEDHQD